MPECLLKRPVRFTGRFFVVCWADKTEQFVASKLGLEREL